MKKVSVIIPAYNSERYIEKCLDSLVSQTLKDIEIIVINDGSTDKTKEILKRYQNDYKNKIKVINNKNHGIGYSRNLGIKLSTAKYVTFVDSDDYLDLDNLEKMYNLAEENSLDLVVCDLKKVNEAGVEIGIEHNEIQNNTNFKEDPSVLLNINLGPANKLFLKKNFDDKTLRFSEQYKYEDLAVIPLVICAANKIGKLNGSYYNYLIHNNSETTTMDKRVFDVLKVLESVNKCINKLSYYQDVAEYVEYLNIRTIFRYTLQQKKQRNSEVRNDFIDASFDFLKNNFPNWKKNKLLRKRNLFKRTIESSKLLTKIYCSL